MANDDDEDFIIASTPEEALREVARRQGMAAMNRQADQYAVYRLFEELDEDQAITLDKLLTRISLAEDSKQVASFYLGVSTASIAARFGIDPVTGAKPVTDQDDDER